MRRRTDPRGTHRPALHALTVLLLLGAAACGPAAAPAADAPPTGAPTAEATSSAAPAAGMCLEGTTDCVDTPGLGDGDPLPLDETGIAQRRRDAEAILGMAESEVAGTVRVGRRGDEHLALTEDYVIGRITVELDPDPAGVQRVTAATVELPAGPETFTADG